jgi:hypothetical protein
VTDRLTTDPATFDIGTPELIPLGVSFAARLAVGESVASVISRSITHKASGAVIAAALSGSASLASPVVTQTIDPSTLSRNAEYEYVVTVAIGSRRESSITILRVVF